MIFFVAEANDEEGNRMCAVRWPGDLSALVPLMAMLRESRMSFLPIRLARCCLFSRRWPEWMPIGQAIGIFGNRQGQPL